MSIIIDGRNVDGALLHSNVHTYKQCPQYLIRSGLGARNRTEIIDMIVLHWTGGENSALTVHGVLQRKRLGVEFIIDALGMIYQTCDPVKTCCYHAGRFNGRSIGIEVVNYGFAWPVSHKINVSRVPKGGRSRTVYKTKVNGKRKYLADFSASQTSSIVRLISCLLDNIETIPPEVPFGEDGVLQRTMTYHEATAFAGVCGHYHLNRKKIDPGTRIMQTLNFALLRKSFGLYDACTEDYNDN